MVRLLSGALVALGPLIIMFLLFDATRGLVLGWTRGLVGLVVAGIISIIVVDIETALLVPWLSDLLAKRAAEQPIFGAASQLLATTIIFAIVTFAGLRLSQRLMAIVLPSGSMRTPSIDQTRSATSTVFGQPTEQRAMVVASEHTQRRAQAVAEAITVADHRRTRLASAPQAGDAMRSSGTTSGLAPSWTGGQARATSGTGRRVTLRGSASSVRRDRR